MVSNWENITILFSTGPRSPKPPSGLTLGDLLLANRFPPSPFQAYEVPGDGRLKPVPMSLALSEIPEGHKVILQCVRNTDIDSLDPSNLEKIPHTQDPVAAMYEFQYVNKTRAPDHRIHLVDDACLRDIVFGKISDFLTRYEVPVPMVAGISGGAATRTTARSTTANVSTRRPRSGPRSTTSLTASMPSYPRCPCRS